MKNFMNMLLFCCLCMLLANATTELRGQSPFTPVNPTGISNTIILPVVTNSTGGPLFTTASFSLRAGDEIGVFTASGLCVGKVAWPSTPTNLTITVVGANLSPGLANAETMLFRVWTSTNNTVYTVSNSLYNPDVTAPGIGNFASTGLFEQFHRLTTLANISPFSIITASVSGYIQSALGQNDGVTMTLSRTGTTLVTTSTLGGYYQFNTVPHNSGYTLVPSKPGYNFSPTQSTLSVSGNIVNQNFSISPKVGGTISGATTAGVTLTLQGVGGTFTTTSNLDGSYAFIYSIPNGTYTLTASHPYFTFFPATRTITVTSDVGQTYPFIAGVSISGVVQGAGLGTVEVEIIGNGFVGTATTGTGGAFTLTGVPPGNNYTVFAKGFHTFLPTSRIINVSTSNLSGVDFTIIQSGFGANKAGGTANTESNSIARDVAGNMYITGNFSGTEVFGNTILESAGGSDIFVAKLTPQGVWEWAIRGGGGLNDISVDINLTHPGFLYIAGSVKGDVRFGSQTFIASGDRERVFMAKVSLNGAWEWAKVVGSGNWNYGKGVVSDSLGNGYIIGNFSYPISFGSVSLYNVEHDVFIAKISPIGDWLWAIKAGGSSDDYGNKIAIDNNANIYCTGSFSGSATFGGTTLSGGGFVAKLNSSGVWQWAIPFGGSDIAVDNDGNIYTIIGSSIRKIDSNGVIQWTSIASGSAGSGIAVDSSGNVYCTGYFYGTATFGSTTLTSNGSADIFVAKLNSSGVWQSAVRAGGTTNDIGNSIAVDGSGNVYSTGYFSGAVTFGGTTLFGTNNNSAFVWKLPATPTYSVSGTVSGALSNGVTVTISGNGITTTATTVQGGQFLVPNITNGTYTVTPTFTGATFTPSSRSITVNNDGVANIDFTAIGYYTVTGQVIGAPQPVAVQLSGTGFTTRSTASTVSGMFAFEGVPTGSYTVTPILTGYTFTPSSRTVQVSNAPVQVESFQAVALPPPVYSVSGSLSGMSQSAVAVITLTNGSFTTSATRIGNGSYSFSSVPAGTYTLGVTSAGYTFSPASRTITLSSNLSSQNFSGNGIYVVRGQLSGVATMTIPLRLQGNGITRNISSDVLGAFAIADIPNGSYTVTINPDNTLQGIIFEPSSFSFSVSFADVSGINFSSYVANRIEGSVSGTLLSTPILTLEGGSPYRILTTTATPTYSFSNLPNGTYTVSIQAPGHTFAPSAVTVGVQNSVITQNFQSTYVAGGSHIAGNVQGINGRAVTITAQIAGGGTTTATVNPTTGEYILFPQVSGTTITLIPSSTVGLLFVPAQRTVVLGSTNLLGQDFTIVTSGTHPAPWTFTANTGNNSSIVWSTGAVVTVGRRNAVIGDAIGYFYTTSTGNVTCAGYTVWQGNNTAITVWGDDPQTGAKDGFAVGENLTARYWDAVLGRAYPAELTYSVGPSTYQVNGFSVIASATAIIDDTLRIPLQTGWNMVSTYVSAATMTIGTVLTGNTNVYLVKNNVGQSYLPSFGINQIGSWNVREGYQIYTTGADTLRFIGKSFNTEPIAMPVGWNMVSYLRKTPMTIEQALSSITGQLLIAKNNAGQNYIPSFGINQIGNMVPGQGYHAYVQSGTTLLYPANGRFLAEEVELTPMPQILVRGQLSSAQGTAIVVLSGYDGEEIGAYTADGMLVGSGVLQNGKAALTLWGADSYSTGATEGESLSLRKVGYSGSIALEPMRIHSLVSGRTSEGLQYATGEVWFVEAEAAKQAVARVYPNPSDRYVHIESGVNTLREVIIRDGLGREVYRELVTTGGSSTSIDVSQWQTGSYTAELHSNVGITTLRFVVIR